MMFKKGGAKAVGEVFIDTRTRSYSRQRYLADC